MSPTIHHKYKYFDSAVQRAKDRRQQFHFCRLPFDVTSSLISLLSKQELSKMTTMYPAIISFSSRRPSYGNFKSKTSRKGDYCNIFLHESKTF